MDRKSYLILGLLFIITGAMGFLLSFFLFSLNTEGCPMGSRMMSRGMRGGMIGDMLRTDFSSNGEKIYYTGINSKGYIIKNSHGMQGVGCAMCHGTDAKGMVMMGMEMPALTWGHLTDPEGHTHLNGRKHPPFTVGSFKTCVLIGVDPSGNKLNEMMARWQISNEDIDDLIEYLKTR